MHVDIDFDAHKRVKGRKRHILVDTFGLLVANRVKPADTSDLRAGASVAWLFPRIWTAIRVRQEVGVTQLEHGKCGYQRRNSPEFVVEGFRTPDNRITGASCCSLVITHLL